MGERNAIVISRATLASLMRCSEATVKRATQELKVGKWIQVVQIGGKGGLNAYVVNSAVAWGQKREHLHLANFTATVVANASEQDESTLEHCDLRRIPVFVSADALSGE